LARIDASILSLLRTRRGGNGRCLAAADLAQLARDARLLLQFAAFGVPIITPSHFVPTVRPQGGGWRPSGGYREHRIAVDAHLTKAVVETGGAIALTAGAASLVQGRHEFNSGIAPKRGKASGRLTADCSGTAAGRVGQTPLNCDEIKLEAERRWGPIRHPTVEEIARMVLRVAAAVGWERVVVYKADLKNAFGLLDFAPADAHRMSTATMDGVVVFFLRGNFGWTCMPFVFDVVTRVLRTLYRYVLPGASECDMYVDDSIGVSDRDTWRSDADAVGSVMCRLLGDDAEEPSKRGSTELSSDRCTTVGRRCGCLRRRT
jgi:hypothetical protein